MPEAPLPTRAQISQAIVLSAGYLERACGPDGKFVYKININSGEKSNSYNIVRHAGAMYAEAIFVYGEMLHRYHAVAAPFVIVEVPELARRFRETPRTIKDALELLERTGRAARSDRRGFWRLYLAIDAAPLSRGSSAGR